MNSNVFEILSAMGSGSSLRQDVYEIQTLIADHFRKKYINRLAKIINSEIISLKTNPSDDLRLLYALKPYAKGSGKGIMDNIIEATAMVRAIGNIRGSLPPSSPVVTAASPSSIRPDGVYDIDTECSSIKASAQTGDNRDLVFSLILLCLFINAFDM